MIRLPFRADKNASGAAAAAAICIGRSKVIYVTSGFDGQMCLVLFWTRVLFPDCLAPFKNTIGLTFNAAASLDVMNLGIVFISFFCKNKGRLYKIKSQTLVLQNFNS
ncbi:hypothetical protein D3C86_1682870 [compost metagenome]